MSTHSYYDDDTADFERFLRSNRPPMPHPPRPIYYDRAAPYGYHDHTPRYATRSEYPGRPVPIHEPEEVLPGEQPSRKRVSVACQRCRKRKIKCSGSMGDGLGCSACRQAGQDGLHCAFMRVGANECEWSGEEVIPMGSGSNVMGTHPTATTFGGDLQPHPAQHSRPAPAEYGSSSYPSHRPSLPMLHTRTTYPIDYDAPYDNSPMNSYTYAPAAVPRQDSFSYELANYRTWNTTAPMSDPITAAYYEPVSTYSFGSLHAPLVPTMQPPPTRLPSVTAEPFSPLNMIHLNASLPTQAVQERRLPPVTVPYRTQYPPPQTPIPHIRPLPSFTDPRAYNPALQKRNAVPWSTDTSSSMLRNGSLGTFESPSGMPVSSTQSPGSYYQTVLGDQFSHLAANGGPGSSELSPLSGPAVSDSFSSSSASSETMLPPANYRYTATSSAPNGYPLPAMMTNDHPAPYRPTPSMFSFGSDNADRQNAGNDHVSDDEEDGPNGHSNGHSQYVTTIRQPQPHHAASAEVLHRRPSYDEHRASTAHRMSLSNLNADY